MSEEWRTVRYVALRRSRGVCELCGAGPSTGKPLHVDHIKPRSKYPEFELDEDNLQVLCYDCNLGKSNTDEIDWRRPAVEVPARFGDPGRVGNPESQQKLSRCPIVGIEHELQPGT